MFTLIRGVLYGTIFTAFVLILLPARLLRSTGISAPETIGGAQIAGGIVLVLGAAVAIWCVLAFALVGRGTPAPFDPPRTLVIAGPYRYVRNPMYIGSGVAVAGAALFLESLGLLGFVAGFFVVAHIFIVLYEEPTLDRLFGKDYRRYRRAVHRWLPTHPVSATSGPDPD